MNPNFEKWSIVVVGNWNPQILQLQWFATHILPKIPELSQEKFNSEFLLAPAMTMRLNSQNVIVTPAQDRLSINPKNETDASLEKCSKLISEICNSLSHTPIAALGINFGFSIPLSEASDELAESFNLRDNPSISGEEFNIQKTFIARTLTKDGKILNIQQALDNNTIQLDFNFHFEVNSTEKVKDILQHGIISYKNEIMGLCQSLYQIS